MTSSKTKFGQGTFIVGTDMLPGTYRSGGSGKSCYWTRLRGFTGLLSAIIANHFGNQGIVTIRSTDKGFQSHRCGSWTKI